MEGAVQRLLEHCKIGLRETLVGFMAGEEGGQEMKYVVQTELE